MRLIIVIGRKDRHGAKNSNYKFCQRAAPNRDLPRWCEIRVIDSQSHTRIALLLDDGLLDPKLPRRKQDKSRPPIGEAFAPQKVGRLQVRKLDKLFKFSV